MAGISSMAWRNVRKHWRHSLASMLTISAGFMAISIFEGYLADLRGHFGDLFRKSSMLGDLIVERRGATRADDPWAAVLREPEQRLIEAILDRTPEADLRVRELDLSGMIDSGGTSAIFIGRGYDVAQGLTMRSPGWEWDVVAGRPLDQAGPGAVLLGVGLAQVVDCAHEGQGPVLDDEAHPVKTDRQVTCRHARVQLSTTTETAQLNAVEPEVVGVISTGLKDLDLRFLYLPLPLAQRLVDTKAISRYTVRLVDPAAAEAVAARLTDAARARGLDLDVVPWLRHRDGELYVQSMELMGMFRSLVLIVVVVVAGMSVWNTMAKSVGERVREIGTLRSLGFRRRHIVQMFTTEAALLAAVATAIGLAITVPLAYLLSHSGIRYKAGLLAEPIPLIIAPVPGAWLTAALFLWLVAIGAAFLPARRAARMKIPDALGHV